MEDAFTSASITVVGPAGLATNCKFVQDLCWHSKRFKWLGKKPGQDMRSSENGLRLKKLTSKCLVRADLLRHVTFILLLLDSFRTLCVLKRAV